VKSNVQVHAFTALAVSFFKSFVYRTCGWTDRSLHRIHRHQQNYGWLIIRVFFDVSTTEAIM
jgi:hypothetical protein